MKIITSHLGTDFDGLAAMVAASKLYPNAIMVFSGRLSQNVKDFMSLYKDRIIIKRPNEIKEEIATCHVDKLIVVDTRIGSRIGELEELANDSEVELIIYDHHPELDEEMKGDWQLVKAVGATTSLLCQEIEKRGIEITPFEATLFTLGIYEDTGCLTFTSTTALDAEAVSFLLENEANLSVVNQFIERPLSSAQQDLFTQLLNSLTVHELNGLKVTTYEAKVDEYIGGIAYLTHKLDDLNRSDVVFTLVRLGSKVLVVARSNIDAVDVSEIVTEYNGGGHAKAASAMIRDEDIVLDDLKAELIGLVQQKMKPSVLAKDIMSNPVKTITPDESIEEAEAIMLRYGHSGLIITKDEEIVGVISRRDIDKVRNYDLMHAPVKGYMSRGVVTINEETTFKEIQQEMVEHDIGRLPVMNDDDELVGIVTRSDVLKVLYGQADYIKGQQNRYGRSMVEVSEESSNVENLLADLDSDLFDLLVKAGRVADQLELNLYIVGGFVRDLILGVKNLDLDLVIEGDGIDFAYKLAERLEGEVKEVHKEFGTAIVKLTDGLKLDIASSRVEYYEYPAAPPQVEAALLKQDLFRRDFTINALAIQLNEKRFGRLIDYFGGEEDLEEGIIRILHNFSFIDDPTRIFRALRFANRYEFEIESLTKELIEHAINQNVIKGLSSGRLGNELFLMLSEEKAGYILLDLDKFGLLAYFHPKLTWGEEEYRLALEIPWINDWLEHLEITEDVTIKIWQLYLIILTKSLSEHVIKHLLLRLKFSKALIDKVIFAKNEAKDILNLLSSSDIKPSKVYYHLEPLSTEEILYLVLLTDEDEVKDWIQDYFLNLRRIELEVTGKDIIDLGYKPGPYFKKALQKVKKAKLNGNFNSYEDEYKYLKDCLKELKKECSE
ncbi:MULTISPECIES: CBS domain-containing protein [unclassified Candidatus Frackibacter]|uniref:CBS domain-containing protein n=1 Tax=unclassified Candidatus Frackibacter TaxID=2648818 RepID=UPI000796F530|nr:MULTISPECIES: CBS domain-containing protein [unclassified Candidatus Frackibacter]KXS43779.1 MAG: tRNA nucleotidyltransferase (CCA-adding enzyme) [Candidatus Frackibacter sp. T328-2]SDC01415.1 tRNA nucleotidyltransferase (CCA-adding enzyme) [Candidatus Frackibacter sp. WG11]SEM32645.1 tRNA nucleotidyltransferase (CCA-adding enzyme) [Candidatus Frackibacter sp. WG12]SFL37611.1 tRNA nucleotidyltransferase (CCA-adding enzyme) [Candidatus Frackibacter sp. WG13]